MPVNLANRPAKGPPLVSERLKSQRVLNSCKTLDLVVINDCHQIIEVMVRREEDCLPRRSLVTLAVAQQRKNTVRLTVALARNSHAAGNRQPVSQGPSRCLDARSPVLREMPSQGTAVPAVSLKFMDWKEPFLSQRRVDGG